MEARKLEMAEIIPFKEKKEIDLTFMRIANAKQELIAREKAAKEYSAGCKRNSIIDKDDIWCFLSGLSIFAFLLSMYFLGIVL